MCASTQYEHHSPPNTSRNRFAGSHAGPPQSSHARYPSASQVGQSASVIIITSRRPPTFEPGEHLARVVPAVLADSEESRSGPLVVELVEGRCRNAQKRRRLSESPETN